MAKPKRFYYECIFICDLGHWAPDQRTERWIRRGRSLIQPMKVLHSIRVSPSRGYNARGEEFPPDYIVTDRPLARNYTEEITKKVSRPKFDNRGSRDGREMREKIGKVKFRLLDADEVMESVRRNAYDLDWVDNLFEDAITDVHLPAETAAMAKAGEKLLQGGKG